LDDIQVFSRQRSHRASRIRAWMRSETSQLWSTIALFTTGPVSRIMGEYLCDEYMYTRQRDMSDDKAAVDLWAERRRGQKSTPTLLEFMGGNMSKLKEMQREIVSLLRDDSVAIFLRDAFPGLPASAVFGGLQQMALEAAGDIFLRFTCEYREFPYKLLRLVQDGVPLEEQRAIATEFLRKPACCLPAQFEGVIKQMYPTVQAAYYYYYFYYYYYLLLLLP
jgi:hypothetical protein